MTSEKEKMKTPEEKYEEACLELAVYRMLQEEGKAADVALSEADEKDIAQQVKEAAPTILNRINGQLRRERFRGQVIRQTRKILQTAAIIVMVLCTAFTVAVLFDAEMRVSAARFFEIVRPRHSDISYPDGISREDVPEGWTADYFPAYIPESFNLRRCIYDRMAAGNPCRAEYMDDENRILEIEVWEGVNGGGHDAVVNAEKSEISLHGTTATVLNRNDGSCFLVWEMNEHFFVVYAETGYETAYAVALSMSFVEK